MVAAGQVEAVVAGGGGGGAAEGEGSRGEGAGTLGAQALPQYGADLERRHPQRRGAPRVLGERTVQPDHLGAGFELLGERAENPGAGTAQFTEGTERGPRGRRPGRVALPARPRALCSG